MPVTYKLHYFNLRGRAELSRLVFAAAGVEYEDVRIERENWPEIKKKMPQGALPVLEVDGKMLCQSMAIVRYLSRTFDLYGKDSWEQALIDEVLELVGDVISASIKAYFGDEDSKAAGMKVLTEEVIPKFLRILEKTLSENNSGYLVGDSLSIADLSVFDIQEGMVKMKPDILDNTPSVKAHRQKISEIQGIKDWVAKRPETPM